MLTIGVEVDGIRIIANVIAVTNKTPKELIIALAPILSRINPAKGHTQAFITLATDK